RRPGPGRHRRDPGGEAMRPLLLALAFAGMVGIVGCSGLQPVGPFAKQQPLTKQGQPLPGTQDAVTVPAVRPTPPAFFVDPGDVNANTVNASIEAFNAELSADTKSIPTGPVTVETSVIRGRMR